MNEILYRAKQYYKSHGLKYTMKQIFVVLKRTSLIDKYQLFYSDLNRLSPDEEDSSQQYSVNAFDSYEKVPNEFVEKIRTVRGQTATKKLFELRFTKNAVLWILYENLNSCGFIWSINKAPIQTYFFPLTVNDVHLFDNEIFRNFRGRGLNTILINGVLYGLKKRGCNRVYIETRLWNNPEIRSLEKTKFKKYVTAQKISLFNKIITIRSDEQ